MGSYDKIKQQVVDICHKLIELGYLAGTGGNVSVRIPGQSCMAITPSNYDYSIMQADDVCIVGWDLQTLEGALKPSIECGMHSAVYENRQDANVAIHTHQVYASTLALIDAPIPALFDEQVLFLGRSVEIVPYAPSGTGFLKKRIASQLQNQANAYILKNHGALCLGDTPERAIFNVELLEKCALTYLLALCTGKKVTRIPAAAREIAFAKLREDQERVAALNEGRHE